MDRSDLEIWTAKEVAKLLTLVENETRYYQEVLSVVPIPLAIVGRDLSVSSVNRAFRRSFQIKHEDPANRRLDELIPAGFIKERIPRALDANVPEAGIPFTAPDADGVARPYRLSVIPLPDWYHGKPSEAMVVIEEPDSAGSPAAKLLEELGAALWQIDASTGDIEFANRGPARLLGSGEVAGWMKRVHSEDHARVAWVYEAAMESGAEASVEYRAVRADGSVVWLVDNIRPVTEHGKIVGLRILTTDGSARRSRLDLLIQTREVEATMRLAQHVAHEFNNLWMIVNGYTEVVGDRISSSDLETRASLEEIAKAAQRGVATTQQLLQFGRPPASHPLTLDLNDYLRRSKLEAELHLSPGMAPVSVDPSKLTLALRALADHALALREGEEPLYIETGQNTLISDHADALPRGQFVTLRLGPVRGVTQKRLAHWPEPYFSDADKASAVGLAPVYSQLRLMGVWITLERTPAETAAFILHFPMAAMPEPVAAPVLPPPQAQPPSVPQLETVLVVDDEESIRSLVTRVLGRQGYKVLAAAASGEALRISQEYAGAIHLVVSDVMLPGLRGPQMVDKLRAQRPQLRVLYISGYTDDPELSAGILPPGEGFLQKPFSLVALVSTVRAVLDASGN